jgi:hypothetical protein
MLADIMADVIPTADRTLLETAFAVARSSKDESLLIALASRDDLPRVMDEFIAAAPSVKVQRARFSRPSMDAATIKEALKKEKRAGVLSAIASTTDLPEEIYATLSRSSFRAVASAVLGNESASAQARTAAAMTLASRYDSLPYATRHLLNTALESKTVDRQQVFSSSQEHLQTHMARYADTLSEDQQMFLATRILERAKAIQTDKSLSNHSSYRRHAAVREVVAIACQLIESTDSDKVVSLLAQSEKLLTDASLTALLASRADGLAARTQRLTVALLSSNSAELVSLVHDVVLNKDTKLAKVLAENTALPIHDAARVISILNQTEAVAAVESRNCATTAARLVPSLSLDNLVKLTRRFGLDIVKQLPSNRGYGADVMRVEEFENYAKDFVLACSLTRVREIIKPHYGSCPPAIIRALTEVLSSLPPQSAEILLNLSIDWTGSLGDLVSLGVVLDDNK